MRSYLSEPPVLVAGAACVDFANTVSWRGDPVDVGERLVSYAELLAWSEAAGIVSPDERAALSRAAGARPDAAGLALSEAVLLRESLARLMLRVSPTDPSDLARLNRRLRQAGVGLASVGGELRWDDLAAGEPLDAPASRIARAAAVLLASPDGRRIRACADTRCGWLFIDASPSGDRRWCRMSTCGNRAKARAHAARARAMAGG